MTTLKASFDDWASLDGKTVHRTVTVFMEHQQVQITTDDGGKVTLSRAAIRKLAALVDIS